jgi:HK97 family phage major capsid protein
MKKSVELKQERTAKLEAQQAIVDKAKAENRDMSDAENTQFDNLTEEIRAFKAKIERAEIVEANELELAKRTAIPVDTTVPDAEGAEKEKVFERASIIKALNAANPANRQELTGAEKEMHEIGLQESRNAKVDVPDDSRLSIPLSYLGRASQQTVSEDSGEYGGVLVQTQAPKMVAPLRPKLWIEEMGATFMTGLSGGDIPLIVDNDFDMTWLAETAAITPQKKKYEGPSLSPKRAGGAVDISNRLLMQSSVDVENRIVNGLKRGFSNLLHGACINGPGGVAPTGILSIAGVNVAAAVAAGAATWAQIVELQGLIEEDNATSESLGFLIHPKLKAALKQIKKDAGSGRFLLEGAAIDGIKYVSTSLIPTLDAGGTDVYPLIYGDFSQMVIGQWGAINVTVNPYSADLANSLRLVLNTHADMQVAQPKCFAKNAFLSGATS